MTVDERRIYLEHLKDKADALISEPKWSYLYKEHLLQSLELYRLATVKNNKRFYRDSISRANKVLEGVIKLLFNIAKALVPTINDQNTLFLKTQELLNHNKISNIFRTKLDLYRQVTRNPETHQVFTDFGANDAKAAINEALIFYNIGIENYHIIEERRDPIDNLNYLYLLFNSFIECFTIYSQFFSLYDKRSNGIYSENIDVLVNLIQEYYDNSIFSGEFIMTSHKSMNRLKPHYNISLGNSSITFNIIKISDYEMMISQSIPRLSEKIYKYQSTFNNLYFLIWSFTNRSRLYEAIRLFGDIPHFHINGLNNVEGTEFNKKLGDFMML